MTLKIALKEIPAAWKDVYENGDIDLPKHLSGAVGSGQFFIDDTNPPSPPKYRELELKATKDAGCIEGQLTKSVACCPTGEQKGHFSIWAYRLFMGGTTNILANYEVKWSYECEGSGKDCKVKKALTSDITLVNEDPKGNLKAPPGWNKRGVE